MKVEGRVDTLTSGLCSMYAACADMCSRVSFPVSLVSPSFELEDVVVALLCGGWTNGCMVIGIGDITLPLR